MVLSNPRYQAPLLIISHKKGCADKHNREKDTSRGGGGETLPEPWERCEMVKVRPYDKNMQCFHLPCSGLAVFAKNTLPPVIATRKTLQSATKQQ